MTDDHISKSLQDLKKQIDKELGQKSKYADKHMAITYCGGCGYEPRAEALAAEIGREFGVRVEMHRTVGGVFEVDLGDSRVFSKILLGRFPEEGEVVKIMKAKLGE
ncbi:MAG: Rdx family protein [Candidatus Obscuribacter sp.]|jgi:selT/selW/selH-like putative selenoprotein|nr:Rdx family protein [Candidatus Obscuribacter sp.]MBK7840664.1 Rdx family protein [Candidatus Obscuribacter sp.]MBK9206695.1 Rdx family protein [Candidatus Obscuribacter sp.]MBK9620881.1 Rdx family protein [Candidatus Obscuribacter sp.]MBK9771338.1 Rdx family protein [Candidatus Obscuribacter sp.]